MTTMISYVSVFVGGARVRVPLAQLGSHVTIAHIDEHASAQHAGAEVPEGAEALVIPLTDAVARASLSPDH